MLLVIALYVAALGAGVAAGYFLAVPALVVTAAFAVGFLVWLWSDMDRGGGSGAIGALLVIWIPLLLATVAMVLTAVIVRWAGGMPDFGSWFIR